LGWRVGNLIDGADFFRSEFDVVVFSGAEEEADAAVDLRVMVALDLKTVVQSDALGCASSGCKARECR
jgi:hypothetical protein